MVISDRSPQSKDFISVAVLMDVTLYEGKMAVPEEGPIDHTVFCLDNVIH